MRLGRYEIIDEIGAGGMGRVRLARDPGGRLVVLKTALRNDIDDDERLRDEARVGLRIHHPSLVETLELFEVDDAKAKRQRPVLVTAYVPGVSLLELRKVGKLPPAMVCRLGRQLSEALDAIHDAKDDDGRLLGVLHRDVTAGNCLVGHDGRARLIDLGISRSADSRALRTETGLLRGTLRYLAPELFDGGQYSPQSDLWALGVVLWEALIGRAAVAGSDAVAVGRICSGNLMMLDDGEGADPRVSRAIAQLLKKAAHDRPRRAREAAALFAMLEKALPGNPDEQAQQLVWRAIGGPAVEGETAVVVEQASRNFQDEDAMTPTGPVQKQQWQTTPSTPAAAATANDPFAPKRTPSQSIADYAQSLVAMEKALAAASARADAADRAVLAALPVVTGQPVEPSEKHTRPAIPNPNQSNQGFLLEETADELQLVDVDQIEQAQTEHETPGWGVNAVTPEQVRAAQSDSFQFPPAFPLPPQTPLMVTSATRSPPPSQGAFADHDEISTPVARSLPVVHDFTPLRDDELAALRPRLRPAAVLAVLLALLLLVGAGLVAGAHFGVVHLPVGLPLR